MKTLPINLDAFGFVEREIKNGTLVKNRCGRDFIYYALAYYFPKTYNPKNINPEKLEKSGLIGQSMPSFLVWTGLSFMKLGSHLHELGLTLTINNLAIKNYFDFIRSLVTPPKGSVDEYIELIQSYVNQGIVTGIDVSISATGLTDHVMFVYGYDDENLYVFDTHQTPRLSYEKITPANDMRYIMKLPKTEIKKRWTQFSRVWIVQK